MKPKHSGSYLAFILSSFALACSWPSEAFALNVAQWKLGLYGRSTDDSLSSSRIVGLAGLVNLVRDVSPSLQARFLGGVLLEAGASSALFTNEFEPRTRIAMQEASLRWNFYGPLSVVGGVLDQRHHGSPLLVDGGSFPAAMLAYDNGPGGFVLHADGQAAIPVTRTFSTRPTGKDSTPLLFTQKLIFGYEHRPSGAKALGRVTHYQFRGLTHGLAQEGRFYGNSIAGAGGSAAYLYNFEGFEAGPDFIMQLTGRISWTVGASYLQNTRGPRSRDEGLYGYSHVAYRHPSFIIKPGVQWYRNEGDSAPGTFTSAEFGHNNRKGVGASLRLELRKAGVNLELQARRSRLIEAALYQRDQFDYLFLSVELPYANF